MAAPMAIKLEKSIGEVLIRIRHGSGTRESSVRFQTLSLLMRKTSPRSRSNKNKIIKTEPCLPAGNTRRCSVRFPLSFFAFNVLSFLYIVEHCLLSDSRPSPSLKSHRLAKISAHYFIIQIVGLARYQST